MAKNNASGECLGVKWFVNDNHYFAAPSLDIKEASYIGMREKIERSQKAQVATEREKLLIAATWVDNGIVVDGVVTGIHAGNGKLITKPSLGKYKNGVCPRVDWIKMALAEEVGLRLKADHVSNVVDKFIVEGFKGYHFKSENHAAEIERFSKAMEKTKVEAEKTCLDELLKKYPYKAPKY